VKFRYDLNSISAKASPQGPTDGRLINPRATVINSKRELVRMQEKLAEARGADQCGTFLRSSVRLKRAKLIDSTRRFSDRCDLELPCRNRGIDRPICTAGVSCLLALGTQLDRFGEAVERSRVHVVYVDSCLRRKFTRLQVRLSTAAVLSSPYFRNPRRSRGNTPVTRSVRPQITDIHRSALHKSREAADFRD